MRGCARSNSIEWAALLDAFRELAEDLRYAIGEEDGHNLWRRFTSSQLVKRPSSNSRSVRST